MKTYARCLTLVTLLSAFALPAWGGITTVILVDGQGRDSGWLAELPDGQAARNITDILVDPTAGSVTFTVIKDFVGHSGTGTDIEFPIGKITFRQTLPDAQTLTRMVVRGETIQNDTLLPWTSYVWAVLPTGAAWFNTAETAWNASPFTALTWAGQSGSRAGLLTASNGTVPAGATFSPTGSLVVDVSLASNSPVSFDFKQIVVPEPGTLVVLALLPLGRLCRRRSSVA